MQSLASGIKKGYSWIPVLVFAMSMLFYWSTLSPTVMWGDSAKLTLNSYTSLIHRTSGYIKGTIC